LYPGTMPAWDNSPRRWADPHIFLHASAEDFFIWVRAQAGKARRQSTNVDNIFFINAWNEWAEGAFLEPSLSIGRTRLEALRDASTSRRLPLRLDPVLEAVVDADTADLPASDHLFALEARYVELLTELNEGPSGPLSELEHLRAVMGSRGALAEKAVQGTPMMPLFRIVVRFAGVARRLLGSK
jgi:hypothetical protein